MFIYPNVRLSVCPFAVSPYFSWPENPKTNGQTDIRTFVFLRSISFFQTSDAGCISNLHCMGYNTTTAGNLSVARNPFNLLDFLSRNGVYLLATEDKNLAIKEEFFSFCIIGGWIVNISR